MIHRTSACNLLTPWKSDRRPGSRHGAKPRAVPEPKVTFRLGFGALNAPHMR